MVPVLPETLHQQALNMCHDSPASACQGTYKTLERIRHVTYWVNMAHNVERHCRECATCQKSKLPMPVRSPLTNIPIGRPWQMIAIDILEVPVSTKNSRYLLVIQDYFRPDSHKNHSRTGQAVLYIWHPRYHPLRPGSEL